MKCTFGSEQSAKLAKTVWSKWKHPLGSPLPQHLNNLLLFLSRLLPLLEALGPTYPHRHNPPLPLPDHLLPPPEVLLHHRLQGVLPPFLRELHLPGLFKSSLVLHLLYLPSHKNHREGLPLTHLHLNR